MADGDLPKTWDEMLAERWRGKIGQWVRAATLGTLAKVYGEQHMRDYTRKLIELKAMIYPSTFQLAQQVAAGEVDIGMGLYHSAQPVIASGAPLGLRFLDPTPMNTLYGAVVSKGGNPEGAQVLLAWLSTLEGAKAYEAAIGRGNPLIKGTETNERIGKVKLVEYSFAERGHHREGRRRADADADGGGEEALTLNRIVRHRFKSSSQHIRLSCPANAGRPVDHQSRQSNERSGPLPPLEYWITRFRG